jgi:MoxR-like ATPase
MSRKSRRPAQVSPSPAPYEHSGPDFVTQSDPAAEPCSISRLGTIGVYGFDEIESVILAALVTEDPLLLIGECGTGKTFLLNSLSEALGLEHRHYNASLIQFDDLVGFPYPDDAKSQVKFLQTPATVWGAQSVLVDEISRCRPEHQNRLFSLIHERKVQGLSLERLVYRWAAMNPAGWDGGSGYVGSEPLDFALADRFGLVVDAPDWNRLNKGAQARIADPPEKGCSPTTTGNLPGTWPHGATRFVRRWNIAHRR